MRRVLISTKPFIFVLFLVGGQRSPSQQQFSWALQLRKQILKEQITDDRIFFKTSIVPLEPLAQHLEAWLTLPSLSRWLTRTIRLGYAIQFARRPPKFNGLLETSVSVRNAPVLREKIAVLLAKDAIEPVPPAEMRHGFYSPYFIVPKKGGFDQSWICES